MIIKSKGPRKSPIFFETGCLSINLKSDFWLAVFKVKQNFNHRNINVNFVP